MPARTIRAFTALLIVAASANAQHGGEQAGPPQAPAEAKQFAFLVGQYDLTVHPAVSGLAAKIHGVPTLIGTWKGWRAMDGFGVEDELRITDEAGNPKTMAHAVRFYDAAQKRWMASTIDVYRGVFSTSNGEWKDNALQMMSHGIDSEGKAYVVRMRYSDITATSFRFRQERSYDEGKSWGDGALTIDAKRVAASVAR